MRKLEFHDKITLSFSSSMNKKNEKFSSKSTESWKTMSWLHSKFRVWFPETLWLTNLESHIWSWWGWWLHAAPQRFCRLGASPVTLDACLRCAGASHSAQEGDVTFIPTSAQLGPPLNPTPTLTGPWHKPGAGHGRGGGWAGGLWGPFLPASWGARSRSPVSARCCYRAAPLNISLHPPRMGAAHLLGFPNSLFPPQMLFSFPAFFTANT